MTPPLDSWAAQLGFLEVDVAAGIRRMAQRLELAMGVEAPSASSSGAPDGYDGLDGRGPFDRLLTSEWLLAFEEPDEFVRRVALDELSYLRLARSEPRPPGRIAVLVDAGPEQLGAPRLVQVAGLVVLARLAARLQVPLVLGIVGEPEGSWRAGELPELFSAWLSARRAQASTPDQVAAWLDAEPTGERSWYFGGGPAAAVAAARGARVLTATDPVFGPDHVERIAADVDGRRVDLHLPAPASAVALLRGGGLRRTGRRTAPDEEPIGDLRWPRFTSTELRVLGRTDDPRILAWFPVSSDPRPKVRRRAFPGPVLAAGTVGTRTVALVLEGDAVSIRIAGKGLAGLGDLTFHRTVFGLDEAAVERQLDGPAPAVHFHGAALYAPLDGVWWVFEASSEPRSHPGVVAVSATITTDMARLAHRVPHDPSRLVIDYLHNGGWEEGGGCLLGPNHSAAYPLRDSDGRWMLLDGKAPAGVVAPGGEPIGLCYDRSELALVVRSDGGHLLRVVSQARTRTLTAASGDLTHASVHPTHPLVVVQRHDGSMDVVSTATGEVRASVRGTDG